MCSDGSCSRGYVNQYVPQARRGYPNYGGAALSGNTAGCCGKRWAVPACSVVYPYNTCTKTTA